MAGRRHRPAPRADAHRAVVVGIHDAHRRGAGTALAGRPSGSSSAPEKPAPFRTRCGASRNGSRRASAAWPMACCSSARGWAARSPRRLRSCSIQRWGWRTSFVVFGAFGIVWAIAWYRSYRDRPAEHPDVDPEELAWIRDTRNSRRPTPNAQRRTPSRRRGGSCSPARTSTPSARCTSRSATGCISTSPGCRLI